MVPSIPDLTLFIYSKRTILTQCSIFLQDTFLQAKPERSYITSVPFHGCATHAFQMNNTLVCPRRNLTDMRTTNAPCHKPAA